MLAYCSCMLYVPVGYSGPIRINVCKHDSLCKCVLVDYDKVAKHSL